MLVKILWQSLDEHCCQFWLIFSVLSLELHLIPSDLLIDYVNHFIVAELSMFRTCWLHDTDRCLCFGRFVMFSCHDIKFYGETLLVGS